MILSLSGCGKQDDGSLKSSTRLPSDVKIARRLVGVWHESITNLHGVRAAYDETYETNGRVTWSGTFITHSRTQQFFDVGVWRVERGKLYTTVTNSAVNTFALNREYPTDLISVTATQITYSVTNDMVATKVRRQ
jgi:hypothetical protein